ncbi:hypothetical protein FACS189479_09750 [Spirochaetia bacterium]|nr:hypothetical protein FACS189479_09750 [Spirochaetia bacterium]
MGLLAKAAFNTNKPGLLMRGLKKRKALSPAGEVLTQLFDAALDSFRTAAIAASNEFSDPLPGAVSVQGIVLELPAVPGTEEFSVRVNRAVTALGAAAALPSRRCLVLFSGAIDRDLLAHRLSKSLNTQALAVFMADNIQAVSDKIRPYL